MADISIFDVLGPNMVGPSSSHTAGATLISFLAQKMIAPPIKKVGFTLYGSFARTYHGHGTDRALLGGVMGFRTDDPRIRDSFEIASQRGLEYGFSICEANTDIYPNTVDIRLENESGKMLTLRGESIGGGKVHISMINSVKVDLSGEYNTIIVSQQDKPGVIAHITNILSAKNVNIAFMRLYREGRGLMAYTIVETDGHIPEEVREMMLKNPNVHDVMIIEL